MALGTATAFPELARLNPLEISAADHPRNINRLTGGGLIPSRLRGRIRDHHVMAGQQVGAFIRVTQVDRANLPKGRFQFIPPSLERRFESSESGQMPLDTPGG